MSIRLAALLAAGLACVGCAAPTLTSRDSSEFAQGPISATCTAMAGAGRGGTVAFEIRNSGEDARMVRVIGEVRTDREIYLVSSSGLVSGGGSSDVTATFGFPSEVRGVDSARCQVTSVVEE